MAGGAAASAAHRLAAGSARLRRAWRQAVALAALALAVVGLLYFYCAYDLTMAVYLRTQNMRSPGHHFDALSNTILLGMPGDYSLAAERQLALESTFEDIELNARDSDMETIAKDLRELGTYLERGTGTKVILACISREDTYGFGVNRYQVEELGRAFKDYRVILVENDSSRHYREDLKAWAASNPKVKIISRTFNFEKRPSLGFLGAMRNLYVSEIRKPEYADFERVIVFDMDVSRRWPIRSIVASSLVRSADFGARCFHVHLEDHGHRDVLAFRSERHIPEFKYAKYPGSVTPETMAAVHKLTAGWYEDKRSPEVDSCFGGIAVYSRTALTTCKYDPNRDDCEHIALNECIHRHGLTIQLDTRVAIPFHYRTISDGLLVPLLFGDCSKHVLVALCLGALRVYYARYYQAGNRVHSLADVICILRSGVIVQAWFVLLAKGASHRYLFVYFPLACLFEVATLYLASRIMHSYCRRGRPASMGA